MVSVCVRFEVLFHFVLLVVKATGGVPGAERFRTRMVRVRE